MNGNAIRTGSVHWPGPECRVVSAPMRTIDWLARLAPLMALLAMGCVSDAAHARKVIREEHAPSLATVIREDMARHRVGILDAAGRLAPGFVVEDPATRERQMRTALKFIQEPPRGVPQFIASPMAFLAAVGSDGLVIARDVDADDDRMRGEPFGERYPVVRAALAEGRAGYALGEFPNVEEPEETSWSMLFAAPSRRGGRVVGAVVAGIPLWRMAQRLGRQLQVDNADEQGLIQWVYMYKGDRLFHFATPPDLDLIVPDAATRRAGLARSPGGFTGEVQQYSRWYAWGVLPTPRVGEDVGLIIFRSDPM